MVWYIEELTLISAASHSAVNLAQVMVQRGQENCRTKAPLLFLNQKFDIQLEPPLQHPVVNFLSSQNTLIIHDQPRHTKAHIMDTLPPCSS